MTDSATPAAAPNSKAEFQFLADFLVEMEGWDKVFHPDCLQEVVATSARGWVSEQPWELTFPLRGQEGH